MSRKLDSARENVDYILTSSIKRINRYGDLEKITKIDNKLIKEVETLKNEIFSLKNKYYNNNDINLKKTYLSLDFKKEIIVDSIQYDNFVKAVTKFRLIYEEKYILTSTSNTRNPILQIFTDKLLSVINEFLKSSKTSNVKLYKSTDRVKYYKSIVSDNSFTKASEIIIDNLFAGIDSLLSSSKIFQNIIKEKTINKSKSNVLKDVKQNSFEKRRFVLLTINTRSDNNVKLDYRKEMKAIRNFSDKNGYELIIGFDTDRKVFLSFIYFIKPEILHYSGHSNKNGIQFYHSNEEINGLEIGEVYTRGSTSLIFTLINSCNSNEIARDMKNITGCIAIGTKDILLDEVAYTFAEELYRNLDFKYSNDDFDSIFEDTINSCKRELKFTDKSKVNVYEWF